MEINAFLLCRDFVSSQHWCRCHFRRRHRDDNIKFYVIFRAKSYFSWYFQKKILLLQIPFSFVKIKRKRLKRVKLAVQFLSIDSPHSTEFKLNVNRVEKRSLFTFKISIVVVDSSRVLTDILKNMFNGPLKLNAQLNRNNFV